MFEKLKAKRMIRKLTKDKAERKRLLNEMTYNKGKGISPPTLEEIFGDVVKNPLPKNKA